MERLDHYNNKTTQTCATAKNNRMIEIFNHTKTFIANNLDQINQALLLENPADLDSKAQVCLYDNNQLLLLAVALIASIDNGEGKLNMLCSDAQFSNALDHLNSPILHGTKLDPNFNVSAVGTDLSNFPFLYYDNHTDNYKLLIPTVGYLYAGERCDPWGSKPLSSYKNHDCSSSLADWIGTSDYFSSMDLIGFASYSCGTSCVKPNNYDVIAKHIKPICWGANTTLAKYIYHPFTMAVASAGLIFVAEYQSSQRHSGLVTNVYPDGCMLTLSYHHYPFREGLGYDYLCLDAVKNLYLFHERSIEALGNTTYAVEI
jgi:hypothetical protein